MNWGENWRVTVAAILTLFIAPPLAHDAFSRGSTWAGVGYWVAWLASAAFLTWPLVRRLNGPGSGRHSK